MTDFTWTCQRCGTVLHHIQDKNVFKACEAVRLYVTDILSGRVVCPTCGRRFGSGDLANQRVDITPTEVT